MGEKKSQKLNIKQKKETNNKEIKVNKVNKEESGIKNLTKIANIRSLITRNIEIHSNNDKRKMVKYIMGTLEFVDKYNKVIEINEETNYDVLIYFSKFNEKTKTYEKVMEVFSKLDNENTNRYYFDKVVSGVEFDEKYMIFAELNGETGYINLVNKIMYSKEKDYKIIVENNTISKQKVSKEEREALDENETVIVNFEEVNKDIKEEETAIKVSNVHKSFTLFFDKANSIKDRLLFLGRNKNKTTIEILKNINLTIKKGEIVGLIGVNGSGKSTLLKLMTKIIYPNKGSVKTYGKLTSLLELGAGFHPDFSGRENIYFNASIFGLTKAEIDKRLDEIIEFAELGTFIDNPVRTYSSGMYMRLAFSVAINVDADILLVDEILSVGDEHFQEKCFRKLEELKEMGKTIVFVTHSLGSVERFCTRAVWLHKGQIKLDGDIKTVIDTYVEETK